MLPPTSFAVLLLLLPQVLADSVCWDRLAPPEVLALVDWALGLPPGLPLAAPLKDAALRCISRQVRWRGRGGGGGDDREGGGAICTACCSCHSSTCCTCSLLCHICHSSIHQ
jgi:hypothetical protein